MNLPAVHLLSKNNVEYSFQVSWHLVITGHFEHNLPNLSLGWYQQSNFNKIRHQKNNI